MQSGGELERLARGLYRLADLPPLSDPDLATVAKCVPQGVICLILCWPTTSSPHRFPTRSIWPFRARPVIRHSSSRRSTSFGFSRQSFEAGIETHTIDGVPVRIYSPEKTLADCFKFRNKIGLDVAIEALRAYRGRRRHRLQEVLQYARLCRVENVIRPFLEAIA